MNKDLIGKDLIYQFNYWLSEQLKDIAPELYRNRKDFAKAGSATFEMFWKAGLIAMAIGILLGVVLVVTKKDGIRKNLVIYQITNILVNIFRSVPFLILIIFLVPYTKALVGTAFKVKGAIMPLVFGTVPFYSRQVEVALSGVDEGKIEAARSMGSSTMGLIFRVYLPESVPAMIRVTTVTAISLIGLTTMAGAVGAGGLGAFAITFGQSNFKEDIIDVCVVILLIITIILQSLGNGMSRLTTNRKLITIRHGRKAPKAGNAPDTREAAAAQ